MMGPSVVNTGSTKKGFLMGVPKGFRKVVFHLTKAPDSPKVECLVCDECQAMLLLNDLGDFANKHWAWHESTTSALSKITDILGQLVEQSNSLNDIADYLEQNKNNLDVPAKWEKMDEIKGTKQ